MLLPVCMTCNLPVNNRTYVQVEPREIEDEEALENHKNHVQAADDGLQRVVAGEPLFLLQHSDQLQEEKGQIANGEEDCTNPEDGARMTLNGIIRHYSGISGNNLNTHFVIIYDHSAGIPILFPPLVRSEANDVGQEGYGGTKKQGLEDVLIEVVEVALVGDDLGDKSIIALLHFDHRLSYLFYNIYIPWWRPWPSTT